MKTAVPFGLVALIQGCLILSAVAQDNDAKPVPPPIVPTPSASLTAPPSSESVNSWNGNGADRNHHIAAEVGFGVFYPHWGGISTGPAFGTSGSVNFFNENRAGFSAGWSEFNQSRSSTWSFSHRP